MLTDPPHQYDKALHALLEKPLSSQRVAVAYTLLILG